MLGDPAGPHRENGMTFPLRSDCIVIKSVSVVNEERRKENLDRIAHLLDGKLKKFFLNGKVF
jgi:hypothetical protein